MTKGHSVNLLSTKNKMEEGKVPFLVCHLIFMSFIFSQGQSQSGGHGPGGGKKDDKVNMKKKTFVRASWLWQMQQIFPVLVGKVNMNLHHIHMK